MKELILKFINLRVLTLTTDFVLDIYIYIYMCVYNIYIYIYIYTIYIHRYIYILYIKF